MGEQKWILDGSKILWHRERIEQWKRGEHFAPITMEKIWDWIWRSVQMVFY